MSFEMSLKFGLKLIPASSAVRIVRLPISSIENKFFSIPNRSEDVKRNLNGESMRGSDVEVGSTLEPLIVVIPFIVLEEDL